MQALVICSLAKDLKSTVFLIGPQILIMNIKLINYLKDTLKN